MEGISRCAVLVPQVSLCIVMLTLDFPAPAFANTIVGVGVAWAFLTAVVGAVAVRSPPLWPSLTGKKKHFERCSKT